MCVNKQKMQLVEYIFNKSVQTYSNFYYTRVHLNPREFIIFTTRLKIPQNVKALLANVTCKEC